MNTRPDDHVVIRSVLEGDQAAFGIIVERYQRFVFTLVLRYVKNREIAEELSQDVFLKAYRFLGDFKGRSKFSTWLFTIVHTTCLSGMRGRSPQTIMPGDEKISFYAEKISNGIDLENDMDRKSRKVLVGNAILQLPDSERMVITLFYLGEQSLSEIGQIMKINENNVKIKLFRARQKLKQMLAHELKEFQ